MDKPKILLIDLETSLMEVTTFTLYPQSISYKAIKKDWYIICGCWKELGSKQVHGVSVADNPKRFKKDVRDDYHVVKTLADAFREADVLIAHNLKAFDHKKLNARLIYHRLPPLPPILLLDTLSEVRKVAKFTSHRLDHLGNHLGLGKKIDTPPRLWEKAMEGDSKAIKDMVTYCKQDVLLLEDVYTTIRPYMRSHPHVGAMNGKIRFNSCPYCGSNELYISKTRYTAAGLPRYQKICKSCHGYSTHVK